MKKNTLSRSILYTSIIFSLVIVLFCLGVFLLINKTDFRIFDSNSFITDLRETNPITQYFEEDLQEEAILNRRTDSFGQTLSQISYKTVAEEDDLLTDINDLPKLDESEPVKLSETSENQSGISDLTLITVKDDTDSKSKTANTKNSEVVIIYKDSSKDNLGSLGLTKASFTAGESLSKNIDVLRVSDTVDSKTLIKEISQNKNVLAVSENKILTPNALPNDSYIFDEYYYQSTGAEAVWNEDFENAVKVAVLDSGVNADHEDLIGRVETTGVNYVDDSSITYDPLGHGTAVASIIAAQTNNSVGLAGITGNANVTIVPYKVSGSDGRAQLSNFIKAMTDILERDDIQVINVSYGSTTYSEAEEYIYALAEQNGKVVVTSSGNNNSTANQYPAAYDSTLAVGSVNEYNLRCTDADWGTGRGSSYGPYLDLMAPGNNIRIAGNQSDSDYDIEDGTSFSAPMVAGAAALLFAKNNKLSPEEIKLILRKTALDLGEEGWDTEYGYGLLQIDKALEEVDSVSDISEEPEEEQNEELELPSDQESNNLQTSNSVLTLRVGQEHMIENNTSSSLTITSMNDDAAIVYGNGIIKGVGVGTSTIIIHLTDDPTSKTQITVHVTK